MPVTNNNIPIIDLPIWEMLQTQPAASALGVCFATDRRGTSDYIYAFFSTSSFWRYSLKANTWQQLTSPGALGGAGALVTADMVFDPSQGAAGRIWLFMGNATTNAFGYYDIATNAWTQRVITNVPNNFGTDVDMVHTCTTYNPGGNDDFIYLIGNNAVTMYRYSISGNAWTVLAPGVARAGGAGVGCSINWLPSFNTDRLYSLRGGNTSLIDYYTISTNAWTNGVAYTPNTETFTTGTMTTSDQETGVLYIQLNATGKIYRFDPNALTLVPIATQYLLAPGAAIIGDRLSFIKESNGIKYLYLGLHTSSAHLRTPLFF